MPKRFDCEDEPNDFMEMPCRCDCGKWFDLNDGHTSERKKNQLICGQCYDTEQAEIEKEEQIQDWKNQLEDAEFTVKEARRELTKLGALPVKSEASELERMGLLLMQKDAVIEARDARIAELEGEVNDMKDEISSKDSIVEGLEQQVATWSKQDCVNVSRIKDIEAENLQMRDGLYCIIGRIEGVEWEGLEMIQAIQKIKEYATEALKTT